MNIAKCITPERLQCPPYEFTLVPLDDRCNSIRVEVLKGEIRFEETISIYDFVDIKQMLKTGKTMQDISQLPLLFIKLMVSSAIQAKKIKIVEVAQLPYRKLIKKREDAEKLKRTAENEEAKGLLLIAREDLCIVVPKLLIVPPRPQPSKTTNQNDAIKSLFFN